MSKLRVKAAGILLILLALSMDFTPHLLTARVLAQQEDYEGFLGRLENYLRDALPPESEPIEECEYVAPEGFNPTEAERLWRDLAPFISLGYSEQAIRENLTKIYQNTTLPVEADGGMVMLNLTGLRVEKPPDGSVKAKIPVISDKPLNYTYFNSTNVRILYETWNETLVKYYRVEKYTGFYRYVFKDLEYGTVFDVVSRLAVRTFPGFELEKCVFFRVKKSWGDWGYFMGNPVVAVPGHYEEVSVVVPQQEVNYRVLFPAYDPVYTPSSEKPWVVHTNISSTSLNTGETLEIGYRAEYMPYEPMGVKSLEDGGEEPLNATLTLEATDAFQPLSSTVRVLDDDHLSGFFKLQAVKQGLHNITLKLEGNACFSLWPGEQELVYTVQVVGPTSPSVSFSHALDPSLLKHARLTLELSNNGGSAARNVLVEMWGEYAESVSRMVGDIDVGETRREVFTIGLSKPSSYLNIRVSYFDDEGNKYVAEALISVWTNFFVVPEHYEEYTVFIPEHEETRMVFIPDAEYYTHVRFYWLTFSHQDLGPCAPLPTVNGHYSGVELNLVSHLTFTGTELNASSFESEAAYKGGMVMLDVEPYWENLGVFEEENATGLLGVEPSMLKANKAPEGYRTSLVGETWVFSESIIMNTTQFAIYNQTVNNYVMENNLQGEFKIGWNKITNATRLSEPSGETGFLILIYHPLAVKGSGPLKSIQVRNYAGLDANYRLRVSGYQVSGYMTPVGQPPKPPLWENTTSIFQVRSLGDNVLLAGSLAPTGSGYRVQLLYGVNIVAEAFFDLHPEASPFWTGFWDGIKENAWKIILTTAILVVLAIPSGGGSLLAEVKAFLTSTLIPALMAVGVAANIMEIVEAYWAYDRMGKVANVLDNLSSRAMGNGYGNSSSFFRSLGNKVRDSQNLIVGNTALDLLADLTVRDLFIAFGRENATEYEKGKAIGRVVGAALSFVVYASTYYRLFTEGPKLLSWQGKIKSFLRGVYNWVTPPLWDFGVTMGRFAVKEVAASLTLSEQNQRFKEYLNLIREDEVSLNSVVEFTGKYLDDALDFSGRLGLSEKAFLGLLWAYGNTAKDLKGEDWSKFLVEIRDIGGDSRRFADELLSWLYNAEDSIKIEQAVLEVTPRLTGLSAGELENMGKALAKVGDSFENGFKLFNAYFDIPAHYEKSVAEAVKKVFLRYVAEDDAPALSAWCSAVENGWIAARCSGDRVYPRIPEDLAQAYEFEGGEPFTVIIKRGGEEYWVAGSMQKATTYVTPHEKMFENLGLMKGEYVELIPGKIEEASLFPALRSGAGRVDYHFSEKWDSVDGIWISQKGGEGIYLASCRRIGYLDDMGVFHSEPKGTSYYVRKVELGGKLEFDVDEVSKEGYTPVYEIKAWKIGYGELGDAVRPLVEKGWVLFDENTGKVRLTGFQEFGDRGFEYEGKIAADAKHHGGTQAVFVLNPGGKNERALTVRIVANPVTGELESRLDFSYDVKLGDWLDVRELEVDVDNDGRLILRIYHEFRVTAEETVWCNKYMKWEPELKCFDEAEILVGTEFFNRGVGKALQFSYSVEQIDGNKIKLLATSIEDYKSLFLEVKDGYEEHAKGVLSCEILNKVMDYGEVRRVLSLSGDQRIIDKEGYNKGENYFDMFTKKSETELTSAIEVKSAYAIDEESLNLEAKLKDARESLKERFSIVSETEVKLPENNYYAIAIGFTKDGEIYIIWQKFTKAEIMELGD
ncbi:MAG: hypothetical protein QW797_08345 [Thermoproteota archaeon]